MSQGKILRMYDSRAIFENTETGSCLVATQVKDGRELKVCDRSQLADITGPCINMPFEAIFGIYDLLSGSYVAVVIESEPHVNINSGTNNINIRKVKKILLLPLFRNGRLLSEQKQKDENRYLNLLHLSFSKHQFYYSNTFDITLTQQRFALLSQKQLTNALWTRADDRFFWNHNVILDLIACEAHQWIVPFMSAFIDCQLGCEIAEENLKFTLLFISRRSRYRQGCRFTRRGIDDHGNVANFVETEQILIYPDGKVTAYVQIRGSIPVHWSSPVHLKYDPQVQIDEDRTKSIDWCEKHVLQLADTYCDNDYNCNSIIFVNLVDNKKDQKKLGIEFKETIDSVQKRINNLNDKHQIPELLYIWFDFHAECKKKGKWNNLSYLVKQIDDKFRNQRFFCKLSSGIVSSWQSGVIRTNCMDNLDRTNVVQSLMARRSLLMQLGKKTILENSNADVLCTPWKKFESSYKSIWAKNADALSIMYAGTGALKVDFTLTGKRTFKGMYNDGINSCMRYYINNFTDGIKQDGIDIMLGNYKPDPNSIISPFLPRENKESLSDNFIKVFVLMAGIFSGFLIIAPSGGTIQIFFKSILKYNFALLTIAGIELSNNQYMNSLIQWLNNNNIYHFTTDDLDYGLFIAFFSTFLITLLSLYTILISGSKIGDRLVILPQLIREPLANVR